MKTPDTDPAGRRAEIAERLCAVTDRIEAACAQADRDPAEVTLIVVTKFFPATDVVHLHALGARHIGESRDQDAAPKLAELEARDPGLRADLTVHFVGQLQTNKAGAVSRYADAVHSVDRPKLVHALAKACAGRGNDLAVLIQVNLGAAKGRGGATADQMLDLAAQVEAAAGLRLAGLMALVPLGVDPDAAFADLEALHRDLRSAHPEATWLSAGMSGDLEAAIAHGATHLRVGSAILGSRPHLG